MTSQARANAQPDLDDARAALARNDVDAARSILAPLVIDRPQGQHTFLLARTEVLAGRLDVAQELLDAFLESRRDHAGARALQARIHLENGEVYSARTHVDRALAVNPDLAMARQVRDRVDAAERMANVAQHISAIDAGFDEGRIVEPRQHLLDAAELVHAAHLEADWADDAAQAKVAYFHNAADLGAALCNYDPHLIEVSAQCGYITWPQRIQEFVRGKSVLDIGCGFGGYGMGFLVAGATRYVGVDRSMDLDSSRARNKRERKWVDMGVTPRSIARDLPAIDLFQERAEELSIIETFDTIALHNVTEHLQSPESVFEGLLGACRPDTNIVYLHHNFYSWNGHHRKPVQPHQFDADDAEHVQLADWRHIKFAQTVPGDHQFRADLNQIRLDDLRRLTEKYFKIQRWEEVPSTPATLERLDGNVLRRVRRVIPDIERRELETNTVLCVAQPR